MRLIGRLLSAGQVNSWDADSSSAPPPRGCLLGPSTSTHFALSSQFLADGVRHPHPLLLVEGMSYAVGEGRDLDERTTQRDRGDPCRREVAVISPVQTLGD